MYKFSSEKKKKVKSPRYMVSHPKTGSDSPIRSNRESGRDKFRLSLNSTKFDMVVRFRETISTVKSVLSSEI